MYASIYNYIDVQCTMYIYLHVNWMPLVNMSARSDDKEMPPTPHSQLPPSPISSLLLSETVSRKEITFGLALINDAVPA